MNFKPMLAHPISKDIDWNQGYMVQPKLDGVRAYITKDGIFSRNNKQFNNCKHIQTELKDFFNVNPNIILDGELYNHRFKDSFETIISLVKKKKPTQQDRFKASSYLQFHCYDYFNPNSPEIYMQRCNQINWWNTIYNWRSIQTVQTEVIWYEDTLSYYHKRNLKWGYEGSILRVNGLYEQKRSHNLQKVKDWSDTEMTIEEVIEGRGKFSNGIGKLRGVTADGTKVSVPWPNLTLEERKEMWKNRLDLIGKQLTFIFFQRTNAGAYRFPKAKTIRNYE